MKLLTLPPAKVLNKAYLKQNVQQNAIQLFQKNIQTLFQRLNPAESEENQKNLVCDFLKDSYYKDRYEINTAGREDLAIHRGKHNKDAVGVIIENKRIDSPEMITENRPNVKALHELILYYFVEREVKKNIEISHLIATDLHHWFVFDENDFRKNFYENQAFKKIYRTYSDQKKDNGFFYTEVKKLLETLPDLELNCAYFNLAQSTKSEAAQIALYKLLSPEHLLKLPFENDANSLNREFYNELLYIIGLEEVKDGGKKIIQRKTANQRQEGSLLENTINEIEIDNALFNLDNLNTYGQNQEEQLFNVGLELCITWLNRVLFLKLLEGQLIKYHQNNRQYSFLHEGRVKDFDELSELFFEVLAVPTHLRKPSVMERYGNIPYLNSSLFELTELERKTVKIKDLKDRLGVQIYGQTVLKSTHGKRLTGEMSTVKYLFEFLDAYDFASDAAAQIQEQAKTIINASVLGLIFEKINGYRDGSFFTPGFITMYMCRETLRKAVLEKFRSAYSDANIVSFDDLKAFINESGRGKRKEFNDLVNSLRVCDPAVGSGHFLVSALNELIAIKHDLNILLHRDGSKVMDYQITIENDELIILDEENDQLFEYRLNEANKPIERLQKLQETLFHEKETIIENCLFGVDINPNSVKICRLRLWIELLKNAYYVVGGRETEKMEEGQRKSEKNSSFSPDSLSPQLQTLPNIDINIKTGNSLVARFGLEEDLSEVFKKQKFSVKDYKQAVYDYKHSPTKERKAEVLRFIDDIKKEFVQTVYKRDSRRKQINNLRGQLILLNTQNVDIFGNKIKEDAEIESIRLEKLIAQRETELENAINSPIYRNAFEWRFEFPEVLDETGQFVGFDAVVGNPPYIRQEEIKEYKKHFQDSFKTYTASADLYVFFMEKGFDILKTNGQISYIIPNKWMQAGYGKPMRNFLLGKQITEIIDFGDLQVFDGATTYPCIIGLTNDSPSSQFANSTIKTLDFGNSFGDYVLTQKTVFETNNLSDETWILSNSEDQIILSKLKENCISLSEYVGGSSFRGILTGLTEAFIIDEETKNKIIEQDVKSKQILKPVLRGRDIKPYYATSSEMWLVGTFPTLKLNIENYQGVKNHLLAFGKNRLEQSGNANSRKKTSNQWFETQDNIGYWQEFEKPKIMYQVMQVKPCFIYDASGLYCNNSMWIIPKDDKVLLAILNSKMGWWLISKYCTAIQNGYQLIWNYFGQILIPKFSLAQQQPLIQLVEKILAQKREDPKADTQVFEDEIDRLVFDLYGLTEAERAVVLGG